MNTMQRNLILMVLFSMLFIFNACKDNEPKPDPNEKFVGSYQMQLSCNLIDDSNVQENYTLNIAKSSTPTTIQISNIGNLGQPLIAAVDGNSLTITQGMITYEGEQYEINGTGTLNGTALNLNYNIAFQSQQIGTCTESGQKM